MINIQKKVVWYSQLVNLLNVVEIYKKYFKKDNKRQRKSEDTIAYYVGTWYFKDNLNLVRRIDITRNLMITIDDYPIDIKVNKFNKKELLMTDPYGFHLRVNIKNSRPFEFYDEAENTTFRLFVNK